MISCYGYCCDQAAERYCLRCKDNSGFTIAIIPLIMVMGMIAMFVQQGMKPQKDHIYLWFM